MTHKEMLNEVDMLKGNINRICVTKDLKELISMYTWANKRLSEIAKFNLNRIEAESEVEE